MSLGRLREESLRSETAEGNEESPDAGTGALRRQAGDEGLTGSCRLAGRRPGESGPVEADRGSDSKARNEQQWLAKMRAEKRPLMTNKEAAAVAFQRPISMELGKSYMRETQT